jgi:hypothetical protein
VSKVPPWLTDPLHPDEALDCAERIRDLLAI